MPNNPRPQSRRHPAHWLVIFATLLAAALRFVNLGSLPPQAWVDEIWFALRARELLNGAPWVAHYGISNTAGNAGLVYLTALVRGLGVESIVSARPVAALAGALTVPLAYACLRELFRSQFAAYYRIMAACAALIMGALTFMVILGRVGMEPALLPPVSLGVAWQILVAIRRGVSQNRPPRTWLHWAAAGVLAGLAQYNGPHARFVLPLVAYLWLEGWLARRNEANSNFKFQISNLAALTVPMLLVTIPLILTFIAHPDYLTGRVVSVAQGVSQPQNTFTVMASFIFSGDLNARQNLPGAPMLDPLLSVGFVIGLLWATWHVRRPVARILLFWLVLMAIPSALTAEAPHFGRMIGAAIPAAALAVIGWAVAYRWLAERASKISNIKYQISNAVGLLLAASLMWNIYQVFGLWAHSPELPAAFTTKAVEVARELVRRAEAGQAGYVERRIETTDVMAFEYFFEGSPVRRVDFRQCAPYIADTTHGVTYLRLADNNHNFYTFDTLKRLYRNNSTLTRVDLDWQGTYNLLTVTPGVNPLTFDEHPEISFGPGLVEYPVGGERDGNRIRVRISLRVTATQSHDWTLFAHIEHAGDDNQPPLAQADTQPCGAAYPSSQWHVGETIMFPPLVVTLPDGLPAGRYDVVIGLYDLTTGERAPLISADQPLPDNRAILFSFNVP